jgi:hypothetical protein
MFKIWIPNERTAAALDLVGLSDLLREGEAGPNFTEFDKGPDGGPGILIEFPKSFSDPTGKWDVCNWEPCWPDVNRNLAAGRFSWGIPKVGGFAALSPRDLALTNQVRGNDKILGDGRSWVLPCMVLLPHRFTWDPQTGKEAREIHPNWRKLYDRLKWAYDVCLEVIHTGTPADGPKCREYLSEILAVNYRVNAELINRLRLWDDENWWHLFGATTDLDTLIEIQDEVQKKRAVSTPPGSPPGDGPKV